MTGDLEPATRAAPDRPDMLDPTTDSWTQVVADVAKLATYVAGTGLVPTQVRDNPAAITAIILRGRELGLPPMGALASSHVVNGRVGISAETMRALTLAAGHDITYQTATDYECTVRGRRRGTQTWHTVTWTLDQAKRAGLDRRGDVWRNYPRAMLKARATAELCRDLFPDVIGGYPAAEELDEPPTPDDAAPVPALEDAKPTKLRRTNPPQNPPADTPPAAQEPADTPEPDWDAPPPWDTQDATPTPAESTTPTDEPHRPTDPASRDQMRRLMATLNDLGMPTGRTNDDKTARRQLASNILGRDVTSFTELTREDANKLIDTLDQQRTQAATP